MDVYGPCPGCLVLPVPRRKGEVGSSATLGTTSAFKGEHTGIDGNLVKTGATLDGRALARNAAVTLEANTLTISSLSINQPGRIFKDQPWRLLLMNRN